MNGWPGSKPRGGRCNCSPSTPPNAFDEALVVNDLLPGGGLRGDRGADLQKRVGIGHPETSADEHLLGREMHIEARRVDVAAEAVAELAGAMLLVRTFVLREAHVAVDAEHRAAIGPRIGDELLADAGEMRRHRGNEIRHRSLDGFSEAALVGLEPRAIVVRLELAEEREELLGKPLNSAIGAPLSARL